MPKRPPATRTSLTPEQHRARALQAAALREDDIAWKTITEHLGYNTIGAAKAAVKRHTNPNHHTAIVAVRDGVSPEALVDAARDKALTAGGLRTVGLTWRQIAERLEYSSIDAARRAWAKYRDHVPPTEHAATRASRWESLFTETMKLLKEASSAADIKEARAAIQTAQSLLATQPPADWQDHADVAGRALAEHYGASNGAAA